MSKSNTNKSNKFSPDVRERAVRMVQEHRNETVGSFQSSDGISHIQL